MNFNKTNNLLGWVTLIIASAVYVSTMEPTASFWDCGEFIATAYRLEIGHPPGAPMFNMLGRLFSMFATPETAAYAVNLMSALSSAVTIMFLFWTITMLAIKLFAKDGYNPTQSESISILGAGLIGALAYTFSDTFWFSAVEAEVYGMSSMFTAIVFWAILKWERRADQPDADRWIVFIAYMMGLSIGVHLLNLLTIPALTFVYYFKKYKPSLKGIIITSVVGVMILGFVQKGIIPGIVSVAAKFELLFVNGMGLPFNTGTLLWLALLFSGLGYGLHYTTKKAKVHYNTALLCVLVIIIGYSSYGMIVIRSLADPPMDENNPENVFTLLSYLNREQYGAQPILYGHYFNSPLDSKEPYVDGDPVYFQDKKSGKYIISDDRKSSVPNYASEFKTIFPRMWSQEGRHVRAYKEWSNYEGKPIKHRNLSNQIETIRKPTFGENLTFFFKHQIDWMYFRYFMWNFSGRQNDIQGHGNIIHGNWISGISFLDNLRLGDQSKMSDVMQNNKANNKFYLLPFILGLLGLFYQYKKSKKDFAIVAMLFFFTGLAIIIYLNQYPYQPRERDYAYAGSFYAFCIWIGLGVLFLAEQLTKVLKQPVTAGIAATALTLIVPSLMAAEGWDDHDRSGRYTARDLAKAYLDSCKPNAILFTNGDNDTFPLWYVQEVEGYRTDVRVINLSLFNTDWYIDQMRRAAYDAKPAPFSLTEDLYRQGTRDYLPIIDQNQAGKYLEVGRIIKFISNPEFMAPMGSGRKLNYFPTNKFSLPVEREKVIADGTVPAEKINQIVDAIEWEVSGNYLLKKDILMLDLLATNNWERPIYFAITTGSDAYIGLDDHFQLEGLAYRLVPFKTPNRGGQTGYVNTDIMYDNMMNKFSYGGMNVPGAYLDENILRMTMNLRNNFARLANALLAKGETEKAKEVLDRCLEEFPAENVPYNYFMIPVAESYINAGETDKANEILQQVFVNAKQDIDFFFDLSDDKYRSVKSEAQNALSVIYSVANALTQAGIENELQKEAQDALNQYQEVFVAKQSL